MSVVALARSCPVCSGAVDVRSRHIVIAGSSIEVYCSAECLQGAGVANDVIQLSEPAPAARARRRGVRILVSVAVLAAVVVVSDSVHPDSPPPEPSAPPPTAARVAPVIPPIPWPPLPPVDLGP